MSTPYDIKKEAFKVLLEIAKGTPEAIGLTNGTKIEDSLTACKIILSSES